MWRLCAAILVLQLPISAGERVEVTPKGGFESDRERAPTPTRAKVKVPKFDSLAEPANPHAVTMAKYANFEQYAEEAGL